MADHVVYLFFSAAIDIQNEKNGTSKLYTIPGRMLLIRKDSIKKKYQNGSLTSIISPKKLAQKSHILSLYRASHSEDLGILDLRSISIGVPTVKICHFRSNFFGQMMEVREPF